MTEADARCGCRVCGLRLALSAGVNVVCRDDPGMGAAHVAEALAIMLAELVAQQESRESRDSLIALTQRAFDTALCVRRSGRPGPAVH